MFWCWHHQTIKTMTNGTSCEWGLLVKEFHSSLHSAHSGQTGSWGTTGPHLHSFSLKSINTQQNEIIGRIRTHLLSWTTSNNWHPDSVFEKNPAEEILTSEQCVHSLCGGWRNRWASGRRHVRNTCRTRRGFRLCVVNKPLSAVCDRGHGTGPAGFTLTQIAKELHCVALTIQSRI